MVGARQRSLARIEWSSCFLLFSRSSQPCRLDTWRGRLYPVVLQRTSGRSGAVDRWSDGRWGVELDRFWL